MPQSSHLPSGFRPAARRFGALFVVSCFGLVLTGSAFAADVRPDGLLDVGGGPMFPIGLVELGTYVYPDWRDRILDSGANIVWDIEIAYADTSPSCAEVVQAATEGDYYLMIGSGDTWNWDDPATPEWEVDQLMYEIDETHTMIQCLSANPSRVLAFSNRDEPVWTTSRNQIGDIDEPHIRATYDQLHNAWPGALVGMSFAPAHLSQDVKAWKADIASYASATDVMMFACYPYPQGPGTCGPFNVLGYPECTMDRLPLSVDVFVSELNQPGQPLWMIIQGFKNIPLKEARWQAAASVIHGATGIFWAGWSWWHEDGNGNTTWPVTRQVMSEYSSLQHWLTGTDAAGAESSHPDVELRALEGHHDIVVFAISRNGFSGSVELTLPRVRQRWVRLPFEDRKLPHANGVITDTFEPYESHIYRYGAMDAERVSRDGLDAPAVDAATGSFALDTYPNPSRGRTTVRFRMPRAATVLFDVYDTAGRHVAVVGRGTYPAGEGTVVWNGRDLSGRPVAPGAYFVRGRTSGGDVATGRCLIRR